MKIAVTGTSGLIGGALTTALEQDHHTVLRLVRRPATHAHDLFWDPDKGILDAAALEGVEAVIHLAGRPIASRWTPRFKATLLHERAAASALLAKTLRNLRQPPRVYICASAVGFYGVSATLKDEHAPAGSGFAAALCQAIEQPAHVPGIRCVQPRIGVVLSRKGGALARMLPAFKLGLGGPLGDGRQLMSWMSLRDTVRALRFCLDHDLTGPVNVVAPEPIPQTDFARALGHALHRPALLPMPAFMVRLLFGEMGQSLLLDTCAVHPGALQAAGFNWETPTLEVALKDALEN